MTRGEPLLTVRVLGPVELVGAHGFLRLTPLQRTLVATLAAFPGQVVSTDRLAEALWCEGTPASARNRIQSVVSSLRKLAVNDPALDGFIVTRPPGYALRLEPEHTDVSRFEQLVNDGRARAGAGDFGAAVALLRAALSCWRGDAFSDVDAPLVMAEAVRLDEFRRAVTEEMVEIQLSLRDHPDLVAELTGLVARDPLRERLRGQLMVTLYRSGRQAEALEVYRDGAERLAADHGLDPGEEIQRLRQAILVSDPALAAPQSAALDSAAPPGLAPSAAAPDAAAPGRPCLLPADTADFTGREDQVATLTKTMTERVAASAPVAVVTGRAGVGKTALAVRVAHQLRAAFPDGQLFIDLGGAGPRPIPPEVALARFLRALGVDGRAIPDSLDERAELYRAKLADRAVLVVVDNAANAAQVRPLLPGGPACGVLVTGRRPLTVLPAAVRVELDMLSPTLAIELLARIVDPSRVTAEPEAARALVEQCGRLPLAIRIAGGRLAGRPTRPLGWLADRLADRRRRLDELALDDLEVRASLSLSYRGLPNDAQRLFRTLGLLDAPSFAPWLAAALVDAPVEIVGRLLEALVDERLVDQIEPATNQPRYRLHDLVRLYAGERAEAEDSEPERRSALGRALGACLCLTELAVAQAHSGIFEPVHGDASRYPAAPAVLGTMLADRAGWLDAESATLVAAVMRAEAVGLDAHAWDLAGTLHAHLLLRHQVDELRETHEVGLRAARRCGDLRGEAVLLRNTAIQASQMDRVPEALLQAGRSAAVFAAAKDHGQIAATNAFRAMLLGVSGNVREASRLVGPALRVLHSSGSARGEAYALTAQATLMYRQQRLDRAERCLRRALELARSVGFREGETRILGWLGRLHLHRDDALAAQYLESALALLRIENDGSGTVALLPSLAEAYTALGDWAAAERCLSECLQRNRELGSTRTEATALRVRGRLRLAREDVEGAVADLVQAVELARQVDVPWDLAESLRALAEVRQPC